MARTKAPERTTHDAYIKPKPAFDMDTLVHGGPDIEVVEADADFRKIAEDAAFMNELVQIRFLPSQDPNAPKLVELGVNTAGATGKMRAPTEDYPAGKPGVAATGGKSVKKGFERGRVYAIPRYLVEAAAHAKIQVLEQSSHPRNPYEIVQTLRDSFLYPFEVINDPNPKGRAWLDRVMSDPA